MKQIAAALLLTITLTPAVVLAQPYGTQQVPFGTGKKKDWDRKAKIFKDTRISVPVAPGESVLCGPWLGYEHGKPVVLGGDLRCAIAEGKIEFDCRTAGGCVAQWDPQTPHQSGSESGSSQ